jgi:CDP-diacylglycerol--serine O-phosphatidyltransferase
MLWAAIFVGLAAVFDLLDGMIARLLKVSGALGTQLDSLSDLVSFGVVPASMAFVMVRHLAGTPWWAYSVFVMALASAYRLGKFNIDDEQHTYFKGMPTPANALFWAAFSINWGTTVFVGHPTLLVALAVIFSFLLVCNMKMFSLKIKDWSFRQQWIIYLFAVFAAGMFLLAGFSGIALAVICYPIFSYFYFKRKSRF